MSYATLSPEDITAIARETATILKNELFDATADFDFKKTQKRIMQRNHVSPGTIEKYQLLHKVKTRQSVINMIVRGDLKENVDWFYDASGKYQILTSTIKRLNNE